MAGSVGLIDLLELMNTAYEETGKIPREMQDERRPWYIVRLNSYHVLSLNQIAVCTNSSRQHVANVLTKARVPRHIGTRGKLNPYALSWMIVCAKAHYLGWKDWSPEGRQDALRSLALEAGDLAIVSKLTGIDIHLLRKARYGNPFTAL